MSVSLATSCEQLKLIIKVEQYDQKHFFLLFDFFLIEKQF